MPDITITETLTVTERDITDEERRLSHKYNELVGTCLEWAQKQMRFGTTPTRLAITRSVVASAARLSALENKTQMEVHRTAFQNLLSEMTAIDATSTEALAQPTPDQDEEG